MAQPQAKVNKSEEIRTLLEDHPDAKAREVVDTLWHDKGIKVNSAQVYFIMGKLKGRKEQAGKVVSEVPSTSSDPLTTILKVKSWAAEVGGMDKLKAIVDELSEENW